MDIRPRFKSEESSWEDVRAVFWEMSRRCLDREKRTASAFMGGKHGLWVRLVYDFEGGDMFIGGEGGVDDD